MASWTTRGAELSGFLTLLERLEPERSDLLRVLTYHRVGDPDRQDGLYPGLISATPQSFDAQLADLARHHYVISLDELLEARRRGRSLPPRALLLTFDDAYRDFADLAWPALRRRGLPVTLFVPTGFPDRPERVFWWDRLYQAVTASAHPAPVDTAAGRLQLATAAERATCFKRLRDQVKTLPHDDAMELVASVCDGLGDFPGEHSLLSWDQLRALARDGVTLAAHTRTHPLMTQISPDQMREEASGSLADLEREIGPTPPVFAYPSGSFDDRVVGALEREGFELAFTTVRGINDLRRDHPLRLRRIHVGLRTSGAMLRTQLLSTIGTIQRWWPSTRPRFDGRPVPATDRS